MANSFIVSAAKNIEDLVYVTTLLMMDGAGDLISRNLNNKASEPR